MVYAMEEDEIKAYLKAGDIAYRAKQFAYKNVRRNGRY